ncbi:unnamed protein product [Cuscuta campestris]|uniref:Uncharacterized protein n=1 Tax=Cuscuta campestris TaxID=132261 RepID=A0A484K7N4_9ASTE|nr:unnamed protein product [Cuscuta campestris]
MLLGYTLNAIINLTLAVPRRLPATRYRHRPLDWGRSGRVRFISFGQHMDSKTRRKEKIIISNQAREAVEDFTKVGPS